VHTFSSALKIMNKHCRNLIVPAIPESNYLLTRSQWHRVTDILKLH